MKIAATGVLLAVVFGAAAGPSGAQRGDTAVIDKFIASQESDDNGLQAEGIRTIIKGDLNHDGVPDTAVLYTLEGAHGSNNYTQYLAVFLRVNGRLVPVANAPVGGTLDYAEDDADCCPTIKGTTRYVLDDKKLKELKPTPAKPSC